MRTSTRRGLAKYNFATSIPTQKTSLPIHKPKYIKPPSGLPANPVWRDFVQNSQDTRFMNIPCSQWHTDLWLWEKFFQQHEVKSMLEIGTGMGGLSLFFILQGIQKSFTFETYDLLKPTVLDTPLGRLLKLEACFHQGDVKDDLRDYIEERMKGLEHPVLLFCDGGDKIWEMQTFSKFLLKGDYAAVHDWNKSFAARHTPDYMEQIFTVIADAMGSYTRWFTRTK